MVQTLCTIAISAGQRKIILERPHSLHRIFFSVGVVIDQKGWYDSRMSFDDPQFHSSYALNGVLKYFEAEGVDIFQGDVWILNASEKSLSYSATEILSQH